jgi:hypothetical protein
VPVSRQFFEIEQVMSKLFETLQQYEMAPGGLASLLSAEGRELFGDLMPSRTVVNQKASTRLSPPEMIENELVLWFSQDLMEELATLLLGGYERSLWGGIEVGGVFFGTTGKDGVHIRCYRSIMSDHQHGPAFKLSKRDLDDLAQLLADAPKAECLKGLIPVGWFHSACNRPVMPNDDDAAVHDHFFTEPWQVSMILKGSKSGPVTIGLSFREDKYPLPVQPARLFTLGDFRSKSSTLQTEVPVRMRVGLDSTFQRSASPRASERKTA